MLLKKTLELFGYQAQFSNQIGYLSEYADIFRISIKFNMQLIQEKAILCCSCSALEVEILEKYLWRDSLFVKLPT